MNELKVGCIELGRLGNNCYFLHRENEYDAIVVDPTMNGDLIFCKLREKGLTVRAILLTHGHFDHICGTNEMKEISDDALIYAGEKEKELLADPALNMSESANGKAYSVIPDVLVKDGDVITVGTMSCKVIETPGHTAGGVCFYFEEDGVLMSGDTLFCEGFGRTDFPGGSMKDLRASLKRLTEELPEATKVYPGHGDFTTIGHEKEVLFI